MSSAASMQAKRQLREARRMRDLVTPEGLNLPLTIAGWGSRAGALVLDLIFLFLGALAIILALAGIGFGVLEAAMSGTPSPAVELVVVLIILAFWFARYGYFLYFELGPRGATPGKRLIGIRVAARDGGRLTAEAVIARNLLRDIELFLPIGFLFSLIDSDGPNDGVMGWAATVWFLVFMLFPLFNKDRLRAGDLVAGTWVVQAPRVKLASALSVSAGAPPDYRFGEAELSVYGEHELQVLEGVLRQNNPDAMREVAKAICRKIGWDAGAGHEREFLEAFYAALRAHLERGMRFGKRKADKFSA
ncbi:RDD family protein [Altererythrobacter lauratis]|uniref:RDD family protein n=1 Tax=Alteraurantiacibacter lauratis TaxID=2054627 RepID=A0ABV7EF22_9SPHN